MSGYAVAHLDEIEETAPYKCRSYVSGESTLAQARLLSSWTTLGPPSDARSTGSAVRTANWLSLTRARGVSGSGATTPIGRASCSY